MSKREVSKSILVGLRPLKKAKTRVDSYSQFDHLNGQHPWQSAVPEGYIAYPARRLGRGRILYFNFSLAKEMGLLPESHPNEMTQALSEKLVSTFAIQIVNEYDQAAGVRVPKSFLKEHPYMATRYLQLQHSDKRGSTSGDGRSIWNGTIKHKGTTWDVSSRGTGVTRLAPGAVQAQRPLKSGATDFGYGCGMADLDELYGSAIMSEIFHLQGLHTERVLCIVDIGKGLGIGVRAAPNLIRPAHLFLYLKQGRWEPLRKATEFFIQRQIDNGSVKIRGNTEQRYDQMLFHVGRTFAKFSAQLERNYIFAWLDWDGDNVLADGGIIDYGSIRQFGLRHDQYRYDDVDRFSTNLNEQMGKARLTVQVFAQLFDFLKTKKKKPLGRFAKHPILSEFDRCFELECRRVFLTQFGLSESMSESTLKEHRKATENLYQEFLALEKWKTKSGLKRLPDGVNRPAIFNMRNVLREYPAAMVEFNWKKNKLPLSAEQMLRLMESSFAKKRDLRLNSNIKNRIHGFQAAYVRLLREILPQTQQAEFLRSVQIRAQDTNRPGRITGNGAEYLIEEVMRALKRGLSPMEVQAAVELYIAHQTPRHLARSRRTRPVDLSTPVGRLYQSLVNLSFEFEEEI